ncbi:hypothetical protein RB8528 [Rhodopirellula baltica SH 1]|uniref:Uncharacterized protein n=1 Tax=Rhodopirellula baltica (strain DSM 10527 / NCIMB 13988 / SH1) TaxID=243090 RepID=Q7UFJ1_RHOBA|nr:hypothetical protein RB8528 [Rhodopirellula baltica SH 1]
MPPIIPAKRFEIRLPDEQELRSQIVKPSHAVHIKFC